MAGRLVRTGYLLGVALTLSSIIYFFASNWKFMDRLEKVGLSVGLMWLFYGVSAILAYGMKRHDFLGRWLFVAGAVAFGITMALIGQIYNSHADSYWLFFIWLIPTVVLAWITKYEVFYVMSVVLLELTCWFYYFPSSYSIVRGEWESFFLLLLFAFINGVVFILHRSTVVSYLAYTAMHGWLFVIYFHKLVYHYVEWWPYVYVLFFVGFFYYFFAVAKRRAYVLLTSLFAGAFLIVEYFRFVGEHFKTGFLLGGLVVAAAIVYASVYLLKRVKHISSEGAKGRIFLIAFQVIVTLVASFIAIASIMGLLTIWMESFSMNLLFAISIIGFVVPAMWGNSWNPTVRYTLLTIGYGLGIMTTWEISLILLTIYSITLLVYYVLSADTGMRALTNIALSLYSAMIIYNWTDKGRLALLVVVVLNVCLYLFLKRKSGSRLLPLTLGLGAFLLLTNMDFFQLDVDVWYVISNLLFAITIIALLFTPAIHRQRYEHLIVWGYFWLFLFFKYYEFAWDLLDKSISLLLAGLLFFIGTAVLENRRRPVCTKDSDGLYRKWLPLLAVIMAQTIFAGYIVWDKEQHLRHGEVVKLELEPIDPRSLLQGDYVRLRYDISTIPHIDGRGKVQIVLRKDKNGVHRFVHVYSMNGKRQGGYIPQEGDVLLNGTLYGDTIIYGIESYFVPEGTGGNLQERARFAYVRVSETGDALLEEIREK
ncbi:GDYXXLXY domain-containing protein [Thermaerobacillus caldiproteolyticus]|uniref:Putative membrane-anchored protein/putative membrane protein n=1 Tax=Thermaerobacillus caldiproteolyticus TaxID=247480 RepID=A0A7W0C112_9BACL|nr:GDYXXLXY domain-containing protein [Anoxybacillus caldiproteolyticus]MBA2876384.1 putative membrane-anchored protein/putative membrane protein [Anoxybacillus caldiproteolyticus]